MWIFFARFAAKQNRNGGFEAAGKRNETETRGLQLPHMGGAKRNETKRNETEPPWAAVSFCLKTFGFDC
jgi:hypothetical protein